VTSQVKTASIRVSDGRNRRDYCSEHLTKGKSITSGHIKPLNRRQSLHSDTYVILGIEEDEIERRKRRKDRERGKMREE